MADNHVKPTIDELKEQEKIALEEAEKLKDLPPENEPEDNPEPELNEPDPTLDAEPEAEPSPPDAEPEETDEERSDRLEKENKASSREAQKLYAKNRVINKALVEADELPEPTEEELIKEFPDWDMMTETERRFAKETVVSSNWRKKISEARDQATKIEKWNEAVEDFVEDPKTLVDNPELEGKVVQFKEFATQETNNSVPFNILVSAFLHEQSKNKKTNKGRMFENGSGGPNDNPKPKSDKITLDEARKLRETDYNKWKEYLSAGKIESDL